MADAPAPAPMEVETPEEEEVECMYAERFKNKHKYPATGGAKSTMFAILSKMPDARHKKVYKSFKGSKTKEK